MASYAREGSVERTRGLAEFLMDQLSSQPMFMDIDIIPGGMDFEEAIETSIVGRGIGRRSFHKINGSCFSCPGLIAS
jgi:hypothetical protein